MEERLSVAVWHRVPADLRLARARVDLWRIHLRPAARELPSERFVAAALAHYTGGDLADVRWDLARAADTVLVALSAGQPSAVHVEAPTGAAGEAPAPERAAQAALQRLRLRRPPSEDADVTCLELASGEIAAVAAEGVAQGLACWEAEADPALPARYERGASAHLSVRRVFQGVPRWARPVVVPFCPPGWTTGPPDFVGVGAQRSGTSWWFRLIGTHPGVTHARGAPKERHFFDRFSDGVLPPGGVGHYHRLFPRPVGANTGEWTPRYMLDPWAPPMLAQAAPDARILVLLRDPVERWRSGMAHHLRVAEAAGRLVSVHASVEALQRGRYHEQLRELWHHFPRDRVLVLQYERCCADPRGELARTAEFLGLDPSAMPPPEAADAQRSRRSLPVLDERLRAELAARLSDDVESLYVACPSIDPELWPNFRDGGPHGPASARQASR